MFILHIKHSTPDFAAWKQAFDGDPVDRARAGVKSYWVGRAADDPDYVVIELEFATLDEAGRLLTSLRQLWARVEGQVMTNPQARIFEVLEQRDI